MGLCVFERERERERETERERHIAHIYCIESVCDVVLDWPFSSTICSELCAAVAVLSGHPDTHAHGSSACPIS